MTMIQRITTIGCSLAVLGLAWPARALNMGDSMPAADVKMKNVDGRQLSIADIKGAKGTLVIVSCNHCPFVIAWEPRIAEIGNAAMKQGIGVIQLNPNDPSRQAKDSFGEMVKRAKDRGFEFPYVVDAGSTVARALGATRTPEIFLFDSDDKLVYHGAIDDNSRDAGKVEAPWLKAAIDALLAGKDIPVTQSRAIGCSIKFYPKS
jgi:hypothetical protein